MTISNSVLAYDDCYDLFEQALTSDKGIRIEFDEVGKARQHVMRMHQARQLTRNQNTKIYSKDHPMFGKSEYDQLRCSCREVDEVWYVYIEKVQTPNKVEEL